MKLLFKDNLIGYINNTYQEGCWTYGRFEGTEAFLEYKDFFEAMVCEDGFDETEIHEDFLDDENWKIDNGGVLSGICIPAIYEDGEISFRYR